MGRKTLGARSEKYEVEIARKTMRECEEHLVEVLRLLNKRQMMEWLSTADASQLQSVAEGVLSKANGLHMCRVYRRLNKAEEEALQYKQMLELADRKAAHGCTDACCSECDR